MAQRRFSSRGVPKGVILGANFWKKDITVQGRYVKQWESSAGTVYDFLAVKNVHAYVDENNKVLPEGAEGGSVKTFEVFSIGALKGFKIELDNLKFSGFPGFKNGDGVTITCVGLRPQETAGYDPMVEFSIEVESAA